MRAARLLGVLVVVWFVLGARAALACGSWQMQDVEKGHTIYYLINSGEISKSGKDGARGKRIAAQYFDSEAKGGVRVMKGKTVALDIKGGKIVRAGKTIGTVVDDTITIGKTTYTLEFGSAITDEVPLPSWPLKVKRGDTVVLETWLASALCRTGSQDDIRRRVAFYLAWRHGLR